MNLYQIGNWTQSISDVLLAHLLVTHVFFSRMVIVHKVLKGCFIILDL